MCAIFIIIKNELPTCMRFHGIRKRETGDTVVGTNKLSSASYWAQTYGESNLTIVLEDVLTI